MPLFLHDLHAEHVSEFFAVDVMASAVVVLGFLFSERRRLGSSRRIPVIGPMLLGVSVALPLLLYLREEPPKQAACDGRAPQAPALR